MSAALPLVVVMIVATVVASVLVLLPMKPGGYRGSTRRPTTPHPRNPPPPKPAR